MSYIQAQNFLQANKRCRSHAGLTKKIQIADSRLGLVQPHESQKRSLSVEIVSQTHLSLRSTLESRLRHVVIAGVDDELSARVSPVWMSKTPAGKLNTAAIAQRRISLRCTKPHDTGCFHVRILIRSTRHNFWPLHRLIVRDLLRLCAGDCIFHIPVNLYFTCFVIRKMAWEEPRKTGMQYRRLGNSGLHVSVLGLGGWLTYGNRVELE